ncbi:hypothetical protein BMS3Abin04_00068 [bacterium BMS3Abin04]|nr:hypothetical protein BMS3Abin04_00068 [bacterium BMS3Abin04]
MKKYIKILILRIGIFVFMMPISLTLIAQQTRPVGVDSVVVTFSRAPSQVNVLKAPLKYNKAFAISFQEDDAMSPIFNDVYPAFEGKNNNHGMFYTNGCGTNISFKMSSAIVIFANNGQDQLNPIDPWHAKNILNWDQLKTLYQSHWGIENHGLFGRPDTSSLNLIDYAIYRTESYARKKLSDSILFKTFVIPNGVTSFIGELRRKRYHGVIDVGTGPQWIGYMSNNGFNVLSDTINWLKLVKLSRAFTYSGFIPVADSLYSESKRGIHMWYLSGMHALPNNFLGDLNQIYLTYGQPGLDNILIAPDDEILDYLAVKQATRIHTILIGNKLKITFSGNIPTDRLYYALTLNIRSNQSISGIKVYGTDKYSSSGIGKDTALVNLSWKGREYISARVMADSMATLAIAHTVSSESQWDALVAMDYVQMMPDSPQKTALTRKLCDLDQSGWVLPYDPGFCASFHFQNDTTICAGDCITLRGPKGMASYTWKSSLTNTRIGILDSLSVSPQQSTKYFLTEVDKVGNVSKDSVQINVKAVPEIKLHPADTTLLIGGMVSFDAGAGFSNYYWTTGDTTRVVDIFYNDYPNGTDTIRVIGLTGFCVSVGSAVIHFGKPSGIVEFSNSDIRIFPNPNHGVFSISWPALSDKLLFNFTDALGRVIVKKQIRSGATGINISIPWLLPGLYFVQLKSGSRIWINKIIIR